VRIVSELPKTPSQRVQKFMLRAEGVVAGSFDIRPVRSQQHAPAIDVEETQ